MAVRGRSGGDVYALEPAHVHTSTSRRRRAGSPQGRILVVLMRGLQEGDGGGAVSARLTYKHKQPVRRNDHRRRARQSMSAWRTSKHRSAISGDDGIHPVVVDISVEHLTPLSRRRKSNHVAVEGELVEA